MSIEAYTTNILYVYIGLFLFFIFIGVVDIWNRIWRKTSNHWRGIIPCIILYLISAIFSTFIASIAYDDPADPNYVKYKNWELHDFILQDIKTFIIWLLIGVLLYLVFGRKSAEKSTKKGFVILLVCFVILLAVIILLSFSKIK